MTINRKRITRLILVAVAIISTWSHVATAHQIEQAADFAFRLQFGCGTSLHSFDTFTGVFTRILVGPRSVTIPLSLSAAQMRTIYEEVERIRFFDYPEKFNGTLAGAVETTTTTPADSYRFEVQNGGSVHIVSWEDKTGPSSEEAARLRQLFAMIIGFIREVPDVRRLPPAYPCM